MNHAPQNLVTLPHTAWPLWAYINRISLQVLADLRVQRTSDWPFDIGSLGRLAFYLIIPPLTWIGAALIENVVNALL